MKRLALAAAAASFLALPASAALKPGDKAPIFTAAGFLAGNPVTLSLQDSLKKGPVVLYFFPAAHTSGYCARSTPASSPPACWQSARSARWNSSPRWSTRTAC